MRSGIHLESKTPPTVSVAVFVTAKSSSRQGLPRQRCSLIPKNEERMIHSFSKFQRSKVSLFRTVDCGTKPSSVFWDFGRTNAHLLRPLAERHGVAARGDATRTSRSPDSRSFTQSLS